MGQLKSKISEELQKLKGMAFKEKAAYIWGYYKLHIIAVLVIIFLVGSIVDSVWIHPAKKQFLHIAFFGGYVSEESSEALSLELEEKLMSPEERETMGVVCTYFMMDTGDPQMDYMSGQKFVAMIAGGELDLLVAGEGQFEGIAANYMAPLGEVLPAGALEGLSGKLAAAPGEDGEMVNYAIKLDGCEMFEKNGIPVSGQCVGVVVNSGRMDAALEAVGLLFS